MNTESEFQSIENFVEFVLDDERTTFSGYELQKLREGLGRPLSETHSLRVELEELGLTLLDAPKNRRVRTLGSSSDHDRWYGPGSSPCHGGSGWDNIFGILQ